MMQIIFFGTGSSTPSTNKPFRSHAAFGIEINNDFLLFDIGPGTVDKMIQNEIDILKNPTHLFISHYHLDHCLDYIALAKARSLEKKLNGTEVSLNVFGPNGLEELSRDLFERVKKWDYMTKELKVFDILTLKEVKKGEVQKTDVWNVSCTPIKHYDGVSYLLETEGKKIVYSGDMGYDEAITVIGRNADIAILECSYPDREENKGLHLCPEEIGALAKKGQFKHVILTHLYPSCEGREEEMIAKIKAVADCDVSVAFDSMRLIL